MTQVARPSQDMAIGTWTEDDGVTTTTLYDQVDEAVRDDLDFVQSALAPSADKLVFKLSAISDPGVHSGHVLAYVIGKNETDGEQIDHVVKLTEGYQAGVTDGTVIAQWTHTNVDALTLYEQTLSAGQAAAIVDYGDLYLIDEVTQVVPFEGTTFFVADAAAGTMVPPWSNTISSGGGDLPINSNSAPGGGRSFFFKNPSAEAAQNSHYSQVHTYAPTTTMGGHGRFGSGWYSWDMYISAGFNSDDWNMLLGWMTGVGGAPSPIGHLELRKWPNGGSGLLQIGFHAKNAFAGCYTAPTIAGYELTSAYYFMTASSPAGIVAMPRFQWVHVDVEYVMAASNGRVNVWQDNVQIMDLQHANLNTLHGHSIEPCQNSNGGMVLQFGVYGGAKSDGDQSMHVKNFKVTDYRVGV